MRPQGSSFPATRSEAPARPVPNKCLLSHSPRGLIPTAGRRLATRVWFFLAHLTQRLRRPQASLTKSEKRQERLKRRHEKRWETRRQERKPNGDKGEDSRRDRKQTQRESLGGNRDLGQRQWKDRRQEGEKK
ncbi:hypothetical protein TGFOU_407320 [Toxoplasma gondii FOU]|uniref:Uncharacterized protein n=1 Tax=Toxoplasma gondii FOU TaxID=943167 RepID=A0A086JE28_TOXGO|nr:hypothetical protein TGFOU_407320 [Toxoplasma gondii FOU]